MIITNNKSYGVIKGLLKKRKRTGIIACNSCSRACETGGRKKRSFGIRRSKSLPYGRIVYGAKVTPKGRKKSKCMYDMTDRSKA